MNSNWVELGIWGDSIVHGGGDMELGGWVQRLRFYLAGRKLGDHVFNLGLGGNNSADVLARIEPELTARRDHVAHVLVSVGVNDLIYQIKLLGPEDYEANLRRIAEIVRTHGKPLHLLKMVPIQREKEKWAVYNAIIEKVAGATGAGLIDLSTSLESEDMPIDGVHPGGAGHEKIYQTVKRHLLAAGVIPAE